MEREELKPQGDEKSDSNERLRRLINLANSLLTKRDEAMRFRAASGVERRWLEDQSAFDALDDQGAAMIDYATGEATRSNTGAVARSQAKVNVIRGKCETAEGRFSDIILPTDEKNWALKETPVPELVKGLTDDRPVIDTSTGQTLKHPDGTEAKTAEVARAQQKEAKTRMALMEKQIDDQLTECSFNAENRKVIKDACRYGTGVLKGPNIIKRTRKAWVEKNTGGTSVHVMQTVEEHKPESKRVDFRNIYPDPQCGEDIKRAGYIFEVDDILPRELRSLVGVDGYFDDQIQAVLDEDPQKTRVATGRTSKTLEVLKDQQQKGSAYEKWEYNGDVDREDLLALGCDCSEFTDKSLSACVVFVHDRPIKVQLNILDTGDLIYDFFQWTQVVGSPFGIGIIRISIWMQRIIEASWRLMLDNGRDSGGANIVFGKGVEPVDGNYEVTGKKLWRATKAGVDVSKAFAQFQIKNNQAELQAIIELALKFLDMETSIPMLFQGEKAEMPETLGATNIMVDSNNVSLRGRVKIWDDQITSRHISRFYHWNMQYNKRSEIKGDYTVDPKGTSFLLVRDQQARSLVELMALRGDPRVDAEVDWGKAVRELFKSLKLDVLKSEEDKRRDVENKKNQPQQQDPKLEVAKIRSEGEMAKAQLNQQSDMTELKFKAQQAEIERQHDLKVKKMDLQIQMMKLSQERGMQLDEIKSVLARDAAKIGLQRELTDKKLTGPQVVTPPAEPPGRAAPGRAYPD